MDGYTIQTETHKEVCRSSKARECCGKENKSLGVCFDFLKAKNSACATYTAKTHKTAQTANTAQELDSLKTNNSNSITQFIRESASSLRCTEQLCSYTTLPLFLFLGLAHYVQHIGASSNNNLVTDMSAISRARQRRKPFTRGDDVVLRGAAN